MMIYPLRLSTSLLHVKAQKPPAPSERLLASHITADYTKHHVARQNPHATLQTPTRLSQIPHHLTLDPVTDLRAASLSGLGQFVLGPADESVPIPVGVQQRQVHHLDNLPLRIDWNFTAPAVI